MEKVRLWRQGRQELVGVVELDTDNRLLLFHIDNEKERDRVTAVFEETGEVSWAWTRHGDSEWEEQRAEPLTWQWFGFVIVNRLYPLGYQADFGITE